MPKLHEPTSGPDAEIDQGGTGLKEISLHGQYDHLMHKRHPAYKGGGFKKLSPGFWLTMSSGSDKSGREGMGGSYHSGSKNRVMK